MLPPALFRPTTQSVFPTVAAAVCAALLAACGGGGGAAGDGTGTLAASTATAASGGGVVYAGPVSGLGSIVVNGVRFETVGARVHDADDPYGASSYDEPIKLGMTVAVEGSADDAARTGTASTIRLEGGVRGLVSAIDTAAGTFTVNGQKIRSDAATTVFQGVSGLSGLGTSSWVEVYGLPQSDGSLLATRIEAYASSAALASSYKDAATYAVSVRGIVATVAANSFTLPDGAGGTITVNYRAGDVLPEGAALAAGSSVRVLAAAITPGLPVTAARVQVLDASARARTSASGAATKIKGVVDSVSGDTLVVSGTTVNAAGAARPQGMPAVGQIVEVAGTLSGRTLMATKLELENRQTTYTAQPGGSAAAVGYRQELYGMVSAYSQPTGTFVVQGVTVRVDGATRYEYGYSTLANNVYVEVKGALQDGVLLATKVDVKGATASAAGPAAASGNGESSDDKRRSSGGQSFEVYGTLTCSGYPAACEIAVPAGNTIGANLGAATWSAEHGGYVAGTPLFVEAKGALDAAGVFQVVKIERKR